MKRWYTTREVADDLGINVSRVRVLADQLGIGRKIGRDWVFSAADLEALRRRPDRRRKDNAATPKDDGAW